MNEHSSEERTTARHSVFRSYGLPILFGLAFGFLLQKGGVAKFHILVGVLLFQDFTVIKVMMSAVVVGMLGVIILHGMGKLELNVKPTRLGPNILGGLVFGIGFACSGYCPGTGAAALGQNNWDALFMIAGMMAGSYLFAISSGLLDRTVNRWGDRGKLLLPDLVRAPVTPFAAGFVLVLIGALWLLESLAP